MPRQVVPLLYGAGLDRATGILAADAKSGRDLRNVYLYRNKVQVRRGHNHVNTLVDEAGRPLDDVLLIQALQAEQVGLVAGFGSDGRVHLFRVAGDGVGLSPIGIAFTLGAGAHSPPRLTAAEQYKKVFVAHDEAIQALRAATVYYDPFGTPALNTVSADLDGDSTPGPVLFRGVAPYLTYIVGWGYGTEDDPNHPEAVRVSHPDNPTLFDPDDYFLAGQGGSPVLNCFGAGDAQGSVLLVLKPTETHQIFGYDKRTFGIRLVDASYGVAASRLAISLNGVVYFWSLEGPRSSSGGPSEDLAWPLDLIAPDPKDLVKSGDIVDGFACYLPGRRCIKFVFGAREYCLSLWDPSKPKWSYNENGFTSQCAGILFTGGELPTTPPTGAASAVTPTVEADDSIKYDWVNNGLTGGEIAEVWVHAITADTWTLAAQTPALGPTGTATLTGLVPGTLYAAQVRYRRGPNYRADYTSGNPADWPADSLSNTLATTIAAPVLTTAVWSRVSAGVEQVALAWTGSALAESIIYRGGSPIATVPKGTFGYEDQTVTGETSNDYYVTQKNDVESAHSNTITAWTGPFPAPVFETLVICNGDYIASWSTSNPDDVLIDLQDLTAGATFYESVRTTGTPHTGPIAAVDGGPVPNPVNLLDDIHVRLRHVETAFSVDDFSPAVEQNAAFNRDACA